jgi:hypothetical protein
VLARHGKDELVSGAALIPPWPWIDRVQMRHLRDAVYLDHDVAARIFEYLVRKAFDRVLFAAGRVDPVDIGYCCQLLREYTDRNDYTDRIGQ